MKRKRKEDRKRRYTGVREGEEGEEKKRGHGEKKQKGRGEEKERRQERRRKEMGKENE